ncbi:hypothetical protein D3C80_2021010 [compost metagenome]
MWTFSTGTWAMDSSSSTIFALCAADGSPAQSILALSSLLLLTRLIASLMKVSTSAECWRIGASRASAATFSGPSMAMLSRKVGPLILAFSAV